jgi:hypothetical protein
LAAIGLGLLLLAALGAVVANYLDSPLVGTLSFGILALGLIVTACGVLCGWLGMGHSIAQRLTSKRPDTDRRE